MAVSKEYAVMVEWDAIEGEQDAGWDGPFKTLFRAQQEYPPETKPKPGMIRYIGVVIHGDKDEA
jgi:hypothetical protein